jgi:hypothetical protein
LNKTSFAFRKYEWICTEHTESCVWIQRCYMMTESPIIGFMFTGISKWFSHTICYAFCQWHRSDKISGYGMFTSGKMSSFTSTFSTSTQNILFDTKMEMSWKIEKRNTALTHNKIFIQIGLKICVMLSPLLFNFPWIFFFSSSFVVVERKKATDQVSYCHWKSKLMIQKRWFFNLIFCIFVPSQY